MTRRWDQPAGGVPGAGGPAVGTVLPFRRTAVKPRRRRRSAWLRWLRPLASALLLVGLPTALGAWVLTSPRFALAELRVEGVERVERAWVEHRLAPLAGRNLVRLPLGEVQARLASHPWIEGVAVRKELPDGLGVEVRERTAAALVPGDGGPWLVDAGGRPIEPAPAEVAERYLLVVPRRAPTGVEEDDDGAEVREPGSPRGPVAPVPAALAVAGELAAVRPDWAAGLERAEEIGPGQFRLVTSALPFPLLVRRGEVAERAERLGEALPALDRRLGPLARADLRFAGRLVLRPRTEWAGDDDRRDAVETRGLVDVEGERWLG